MSDPRSTGGDREDPSDIRTDGDGRLVLTPALKVQGTAAAGPAAETDDALLRQMVRVILEEELQGGLGTRITREVRKLVRAEVRTLLALRDPD